MFYAQSTIAVKSLLSGRTYGSFTSQNQLYHRNKQTPIRDTYILNAMCTDVLYGRYDFCLISPYCEQALNKTFTSTIFCFCCCCHCYYCILGESSSIIYCCFIGFHCCGMSCAFVGISVVFKYALRGFSVVGTLTYFSIVVSLFVWLPVAPVGGHIGKVPTPYLRRLPLRHVGHRHWLGHSYIVVRSSASCGPLPTGRGQRQSLAGMSSHRLSHTVNNHSHRQSHTVNDHITGSPTQLMTTVTGNLIQLMTTVIGSLPS